MSEATGYLCEFCKQIVPCHLEHICGGKIRTRKPDTVNHPAHYTQGAIECIDYILDKKMDYLEGNVVKYITRYKDKNGVEDLKKARWYIDRLIQETTKKEGV